MSYRWKTFKNSVKGEYKSSQTERAFLLKYYPKYYNKIYLKDIDHLTIVKIKGLKRVHHFSGELQKSQTTNLSLILLQKVRKDLRTLPRIYFCQEFYESKVKRWYGHGLKQIKLYIGVDMIDIPGFFLRDPFKCEKLNNSEKDVMRILRYLAHAKNLKRINLLLNEKKDWFLANKINESKRLIRKLNQVGVSFHDFKKFEIPGLAIKDSLISQSITHFDVFRCQSEDMPELTRALEIFKNLKSLNISRMISHENTFKAIEALSRLEHLNISVEDDILASMTSFALPKSLKFLERAFVSSKSSWKARMSSDEGLQGIPLLPGFSSIIQQLPLLDALCLNFNGLLHVKSVNTLNFLTHLFPGIPKLSVLRLQVPTKPRSEKLDFSPIFDGIQHLMPMLRELEIRFPEDEGPVVFYPSPGYQFPNLSKLEIIGNICSEMDVKQVSLMLTNTKIPPMLEIGYATSIETFEAFLKSLRKIGSLGSNIEMHFGAFLTRVAPKIVFEALVNFIKNTGSFKWLSFDLRVKKSKSWLEELSKAIKGNPVIDDLQVSDDNFEAGDFSYRFWKGVLIEKSEEDVEYTGDVNEESHENDEDYEE